MPDTETSNFRRGKNIFTLLITQTFKWTNQNSKSQARENECVHVTIYSGFISDWFSLTNHAAYKQHKTEGKLFPSLPIKILQEFPLLLGNGGIAFVFNWI